MSERNRDRDRQLLQQCDRHLPKHTSQDRASEQSECSHHNRVPTVSVLPHTRHSDRKAAPASPPKRAAPRRPPPPVILTGFWALREVGVLTGGSRAVALGGS